MNTQQHITLHVSTAIANGEMQQLPEQVTDLAARRLPSLVGTPLRHPSALTASPPQRSRNRAACASADAARTDHAGTDQ